MPRAPAKSARNSGSTSSRQAAVGASSAVAAACGSASPEPGPAPARSLPRSPASRTSHSADRPEPSHQERNKGTWNPPTRRDSPGHHADRRPGSGVKRQPQTTKARSRSIEASVVLLAWGRHAWRPLQMVTPGLHRVFGGRRSRVHQRYRTSLPRKPDRESSSQERFSTSPSVVQSAAHYFRLAGQHQLPTWFSHRPQWRAVHCYRLSHLVQRLCAMIYHSSEV
jgi:hypothetical protein